MAERSFVVNHKRVIITIYNDRSIGQKLSLIDCQDRHCFVASPSPIPPALRSKTLILQENYWRYWLPRQPRLPAAAVLGSGEPLINSTSNSTPMVKRPSCSFWPMDFTLFARLLS
ncbi:hypothetical protein KCP74_24625 [Salmonella enterica subsp. enterica]|nr:hypothetical protein KCP74_24625 [Salmonella enterica subsp. enterica]